MNNNSSFERELLLADPDGIDNFFLQAPTTPPDQLTPDTSSQALIGGPLNNSSINNNNHNNNQLTFGHQANSNHDRPPLPS